MPTIYTKETLPVAYQPASIHLVEIADRKNLDALLPIVNSLHYE